MKATTTNLTAKWWRYYDILRQMPPLPGRAANGDYATAPVIYWISANCRLPMADAVRLFGAYRQAGALVNVHKKGWLLTEKRAAQIRVALRRRRQKAEEGAPR